VKKKEQDNNRKKSNQLSKKDKNLRQSEIYYRTIADFTYDWEYWVDINDKFIYVSPACERISGYNADAFLKDPSLLTRIILPADKAIWDCHHQEVYETLKPGEIQFRIRSRKGDIKWIEHACTPVRSPENEFLGFRASNREITDRKEIENALRKSENSLAEAQRIAHIGNWDWDIENNILYWSDEVYRIFGLKPQEFGATYEAFLASIHPHDRKPVMDAVNQSLADPESVYSITHRVIRRDGGERFVHERGEVTFNEKGNPVRMIGTVHDITERVQMEEKLTQQLEEIKILKSRLEKENIYLREEIKLQYKHEEIIGQSHGIKKVLKQIEQVAPTDSAVLIMGETGCGKERIARAIHNLSKRKDRVMTIVNCASLPPALVESELFGREKGAYTGALSRQIGRFELADNSTILLDEIGELTSEIQAKLLRVLESGEFERLGSPKSIRVDVRVIAATNRNLTEEVKKGNFREDLFYRLNVFPIEIPPLRERKEDIPLLVRAFIYEFTTKMGKRIQTIPRKTMELLMSYSWPGNIRELRNVIEHAVIISTDEILQVRLPEELMVTATGFQTLNQNEYQYITKILEKTNWRIKGKGGAAERLGLKPSSLYSRMKKLGIPTRQKRDDIST
jgi:formate hydrogenlyase transcriptional activator